MVLTPSIHEQYISAIIVILIIIAIHAVTKPFAKNWHNKLDLFLLLNLLSITTLSFINLSIDASSDKNWRRDLIPAVQLCLGSVPLVYMIVYFCKHFLSKKCKQGNSWRLRFDLFHRKFCSRGLILLENIKRLLRVAQVFVSPKLNGGHLYIETVY